MPFDQESSFGPIPRGTVARVIYASEACISHAVYAEMELIRASAMRHNEPVGVYTALLYQSGWFVQWKEGPGAEVLRIMDRVAADPRHRGLRVVHSSRGPRLLSGPWSMAIVQAGETPAEMGERVARLVRDTGRGIQFGPPAVWRRLSTPLRHPGGDRQGNPEAFQRILVCAAGGEESFQLVQWLAGEHSAEVVHRRFAGSQDLDVGTDYVDFEDSDVVLRVIAMARNGLSVPLTRAFLPDYSHIVLLLAGDQARDLALVQRVGRACADLPRAPAIIALAERHHAHEAPLALARRLGLIYLDAIGEPDIPMRAWEAIRPLLALWRDSVAGGGGPSSLGRLP